MKFLFCGDRKWKDIQRILVVMTILKNTFGIFTVIEGEAKGADLISAVTANKLNLPVERYPANWNKYNKAAGPIRNTQMLDEGKPDGVLAFHDNILESKGTKNMVFQSLKAGIPVWISQSSENDLNEFIQAVKDKINEKV